jgi:hypothetical protein
MLQNKLNIMHIMQVIRHYFFSIFVFLGVSSSAIENIERNKSIIFSGNPWFHVGFICNLLEENKSFIPMVEAISAAILTCFHGHP